MAQTLELSSQFVARRDVNMEKATAEIIRLARDHEGYIRACPIVDEAATGRVQVSINVTITDDRALMQSIEASWVKVASRLADFSEAAVSCLTLGELEGDIEWYIGPQNIILQTRLNELHEAMTQLEAERQQILGYFAAAGEQVISSRKTDPRTGQDYSKKEEEEEEGEDEDECSDCHRPVDDCTCEHCPRCGVLRADCDCIHCERCDELTEDCRCSRCDTCDNFTNECTCEEEEDEDEDDDEGGDEGAAEEDEAPVPGNPASTAAVPGQAVPGRSWRTWDPPT